MPSFFYNISNHSSTKWSDKQRNEALTWCGEGGAIVDMAFPNVPPAAGPDEINLIAAALLYKIVPRSVCMIMGETSLVFAFITRAIARGDIRVVVATTERRAVETVDAAGVAVKTATFEFVQFRYVGGGCGDATWQMLVEENR